MSPAQPSKLTLHKQYRPARAAYGNTIVEYILSGVGVLVVAIGALQLFGGNLDGLLLQLKNDMLHHTQIASDANTQHELAHNAFTAAQATQIKTGGSQIPATPVLPGAPVATTATGPITQTVGANGTTESYAQGITDTAKQSLAAGTITQAEYDLIVKVANKGHDIAAVQGLLENAFHQSNGDSNAYANTQLTFNGQTYTPAQLNSVLETNISQFGSLKQQASVLTGVLYDQNLLSTLNDSGAQIINNGYATQQQNQSSASFVQYQSEEPGGGSADTHQQSANICTGGQHLDSGNHCVP